MGSGLRWHSSGSYAIWSSRVLLALTALALLLPHLRDWPPPWLDEGIHIDAAGVLATVGVYGLREGGQVSPFDTEVQVGPAVIAPVALGLRLLGVDHQAARLVMVGFSLGALLAAWMLARQLFDERTALLTVALLLAGSTESFCSLVFMGRQVLAEVPAFGFYCAGMTLLVRPVRLGQRAPLREIAAGALWGATMLSKAQLIPLICGPMALVAIADLCYYRRRVWPMLVLPVLVSLGLVVSWYAVRWVAIPAGDLTSATQLKSSWIAWQFVTTEWIDRRRALSVLARSGFLFLGLPSLLWGLWSSRSRDAEGLTRLLVLAVPCTVLLWFTATSIGWARYAFFAVTMSAMWSAGLLWRLWDLAADRRVGRLWPPPLFAAALTLLLIANGAATVRAIASPPETGFAEMREYLRTQLESNAVIETWEWEFSVDDRPTYTHPDLETLYVTTRLVMSNRPLPPSLYDWRRRHPDYLLLGPFGEWTGIYRLAMPTDVELVTRRARYALYRVRKDARADR
jgi:hypothetical protein